MQNARAAEGERRVAADQWDIDGWQMLAAEAEKATFTDAKPIYERLVSQFPPIGRFWKSYAEHLARGESSDPEHVKALYERAVQEAPTSIDLWRSYISFSSSLAVKTPGSKLENDAIAVYEKALVATGLDLNSNPIWSHYIDFLKKHTTLSDNQRRDALRRVYQRAVMICTSFLLYSSILSALSITSHDEVLCTASLPSLIALRMKKERHRLLNPVADFIESLTFDHALIFI